MTSALGSSSVAQFCGKVVAPATSQSGFSSSSASASGAPTWGVGSASCRLTTSWGSAPWVPTGRCAIGPGGVTCAGEAPAVVLSWDCTRRATALVGDGVEAHTAVAASPVIISAVIPAGLLSAIPCWPVPVTGVAGVTVTVRWPMPPPVTTLGTMPLVVVLGNPLSAACTAPTSCHCWVR